MRARRRIDKLWWPILMVAALILQGCSAVPQLVRHQDPLTAEEHIKLGTSYEAQGLHDKAIEQYQAALKLQKNNVQALIAWGNIAFEKGDWKVAENCYRRILQIDPNHAEANNNLAMVYVTAGKDLDKAEGWAQTALRQGGPLKPYVLDTLATIYIHEQRYADAQKALDEAQSLASPENKSLRDQLTKTREKLP